MRERILAVLIGGAVGLVLAFGLGEIYLRSRHPELMRIQHDRIILPKNQTYIYTHAQLRGCDSRVVHHKNSLGFRGAEPPADFGKALTVVAVGGSTTECFYLSDGHSWPEIVGDQLRPDYPTVWVNNAGLDGHSTFGHTILVDDYLAGLHPNYVLFMVGVNDIGRDDLAREDRTMLKSEQSQGKLAFKLLAEHSRVIAMVENIVRALRARKQGLGHQALELEKQRHFEVALPDAQNTLREHQTRYVEPYKKRLRLLIERSEQAKMQPILITQAALFGTPRDATSGINLDTIEVHEKQNGRLAWQVLELYNDATRSVARQMKVPLLDLARQLPKDSKYFYDYYHFTNAGSEAAGKLIAADLRHYLQNRK